MGASLTRGEKWFKAKAKAEYGLTLDTKTAKAAEGALKWLKSQASIVADIKEYEDSLTKETKSKKEK